MPTFDSDIFASVPTAIAIAHDPLATSITVNRHFATLLGLDGGAPAALASPPGDGADWAIYRAGRRVTPDELPLQVAARTNATVSGWEAEIERRDGTRVAIAGDAVPLYHADGTVRGSVVVFRDISNRTAAAVVERSRLESGCAATLADEQAARREAEAAIEQLHQANRLKDEFLATLSHELRTPLTAILGYARMLRAGMVAAEKQPQAIAIVERTATALAQIVNDVLDVSGIISGKIRLDVKSVDLPAVVREAVAALLPAAGAKGVTIETEITVDAPPIPGDHGRLQQVIWNVVSNAVKFTPRGGCVRVRMESTAAGQDVIVSDTGIGIAPAFLPHIFERFRQADSGPAREHGGLGLGLAIACHIVEMHGGTLHASSAGAGQGATFRMRFPSAASLEAALPDRRTKSGAQPRAEALPDLRGTRVLVVDDDPDALRMVREVLEFAGADVSTAVAAAEAIEQLSACPADVVLADIGMPLIDGFALLAEIRRLPDARVRAVPAAALTAYARAEDRTRVLCSGFQMHLGKPVDPGELVAAVAALSGRTP